MLSVSPSRSSGVALEEEPIPGVGGTFAATNTQEIEFQTHALRPRTRVEVFYPWNSKPGEDLFFSRNVEPIDARIVAVTAINGAIRWKYTIELGYWDMTTAESTGGTWIKTSGDTVLYAFNSAEDKNTFTSGTGVIGTGDTEVAQSDGTLGDSECALLALPVGGYCQVKFRGKGANDAPYFTIINFANSAEPD
jgi:hypothetical protein